MEVKLGAHVYAIVSMTTTSLGHFSLELFLHTSNLLTLARMEVKLGAHVYAIVSMTTTSLGHFSLELFLHTSNLLTLARMEVKLGVHVYLMTTMYKNGGDKNPMDYQKEGI